MIRVISIIAAITFAVVGFGCWGLILLWEEGLQPCENSVVQTLPSPDQRLKAVLFERSCGATTGFSTQISVLEKGARLEGAGNVFIADGGISRGDWGGPWAEMRWLTNEHLAIHHAAATVYRSESEIGRAKVLYVYGPLYQSPSTGAAARSPAS